jgi:hypothetical protein
MPKDKPDMVTICVFADMEHIRLTRDQWLYHWRPFLTEYGKVEGRDYVVIG